MRVRTCGCDQPAGAAWLAAYVPTRVGIAWGLHHAVQGRVLDNDEASHPLPPGSPIGILA
jgi:hypothetical protein